jgi:ADP-ribose pyrophosphatase YjhB (NUDIX family)
MRYRVSAKALVIQDGCLLCSRNEDPGGIFHLLPGGGQEPFESLAETLRRECEEELGPDIGLEVGDLVLSREYVGRNHEFAEEDADIHQIELMFACRVLRPENVGHGTLHDSMQTGVDWIPLDRLRDHRIYPSALRERIGPEGLRPGPTYLGDVN